jgi:hypothetical protein
MQVPGTRQVRYRCEVCNPVGPIESAVREAVQPGDLLQTLSGRGQPAMAYHTPDGLVLIGERILGRRKTVLIPWPALEEIPDFLRGRDWVLVGNLRSAAGAQEGAEHLKAFLRRSTAGWLAVVLARTNVVIIDRVRPARIKLLPWW